ncbi:Abi family protein [Turneriella parva]|uniref:Abi family protein n=1 Tax=Turneriella parva (strain ATCC BAA-1111 / DSM 21527 / NCTC 11395 / H) TaxID=869212 RepID=I4B0B2_TURPD|nr:Abi family protein [Turneriella parva]AFM10719.1 Abi family protein [Turneriella parva DSM 21527]
MEYTKPPLTYEQQADQLISRGLLADRAQLIQRLKSVNYYRLSGYWFPFREYPKDNFKPDTRFEAIWRRYAFDRRLRLMVMDGIERIEIALRADATYHLAHKHGAFGYLEAHALPNLSVDNHARLMTALRSEYSKSKEVFASHFGNKYGEDHDSLPIWMVTELMTIGQLFTLFRGMSKGMLKSIAKTYGVAGPVLFSWLGTLHAVRNICAHHSRLWNRELGYKPTFPDSAEWTEPVAVTDRRVFGVLTILKYMMDRVAPQSSWPQRLMDLLNEYPEIPRRDMGFADNWTDVPMWSDQK